MTDPEADPGTCPLLGITGITPVRPVSVRRWDGTWCVVDLGGLQTLSLRVPGGLITVRKAILPCCCWSYAVGVAEVLAARYRGERAPAWVGRGHPPMRGGTECKEVGVR